MITASNELESTQKAMKAQSEVNRRFFLGQCPQNRSWQNRRWNERVNWKVPE